MTTVLAGILRTEDSTPANQIPVAELRGAIGEILNTYSAQRDAATRLFVRETVTIPEESVPLTAVDEGQDVDRDSRALETRVGDFYAVAYPWVRRGWAHGWDYEAIAYLTVEDINRTVQSKVQGNAKWHLRSIFRALFGNQNWTHLDNEWVTNGAPIQRTIRRLANNDGTLYPAGAIDALEAPATQANHYAITGYTSSDMSGSNNPLATLRTLIRARQATGGRIIAFINSAQLADFRDKLPNLIDSASAVDATIAQTQSVAIAPGVTVPGEYIGVDGDSNVHVFTYDSAVPSGYTIGMITDRPPLKRRVPRATTLQGFKLEADEEHYPLFRHEFRDRAGYGVFDRTAAAVLQFKADGSFDVPSIYA